jgi:Gram-negative bacterial TonB protein C-terminal
MRLFSSFLLWFVLSTHAFSGYAQEGSVAKAVQRAVVQSKLTSPGSTPFHLKAKIVETTNPDSTYKGEIEEYWVSPEKWRRTIQSPGFSQTLIANGDQIFEQDVGDYYPWWLNDLVTATFDPMPMVGDLKAPNQGISTQLNFGKKQSAICGNSAARVGIAPVENSVFSGFCLDGEHGLFDYVLTPEYQARFRDYEDFKDKKVARRIVIEPESGTTIEAAISDLTELKSPDENLFAIPQATPENDRLKRVEITESAIRKLSVKTPDIVWPGVRDGKTHGVLSMYISVDRSGHVRETWPLNSDNPQLDDGAREQVRKWQFKPASMNGTVAQLEAILTFAFDTKVENPLPLLSDVEVRKMASNIVEAVFPSDTPKGTEVKLRVSVDESGTVIGVQNVYQLSNPIFSAAYRAVHQWRFQPYVRLGKSDRYLADIVFHVN